MTQGIILTSLQIIHLDCSKLEVFSLQQSILEPVAPMVSCSECPQYQLVTNVALADLTELLDMTVCMVNKGTYRGFLKSGTNSWGLEVETHSGSLNTRPPQWVSYTRPPQWVVQSLAPAHYQIVITPSLPPTPNPVTCRRHYHCTRLFLIISCHKNKAIENRFVSFIFKWPRGSPLVRLQCRGHKEC